MKYPIPYRKVDNWGFSDSEKSIIIDCIYDEVIFPFSEENFNLALVKSKDKFCWINTKGDQISPLADIVFTFTPKGISLIIIDKENFNSRKSNENCVFINCFGEEVFKIHAITANGFQNDQCIVYFPNNFYGAINSDGKVIIEPEFDNYETIWNKIGRPYFYDRNERPSQNQTLIKIEQNRYFGFKDIHENIVIKPIYFFASDYNEDTSIVAKNPKEFHHINLKEQRLYQQDYYFGFNFEYDIAKVVTDKPNVDPFVHIRWGVDYFIPKDAKWGYIDKKGTEYWEDK